MRSVAGFLLSLLQTPTNDVRHVAAPHFPPAQVCRFRPAPRRRRAAARRGVALGAGALAGGAVLYPLFDVLERRCRPRARYETDERGHARPKYK